MKSNFLIRLGAASTLALVSSGAWAVTAVTVARLNLRAGPATGYPVVTTMPASVQLLSYGCLADLSWCDVSWNGQRGWVSSSYIRVIYHAQPVVLTVASAPIIGVRVAAFDDGYWQRYYVGRPWYGRWPAYAPLRRVTVIGGPVRAPVVHHGVTGCGPRGCVHLGSTYVAPSPRVQRVTVIRP